MHFSAASAALLFSGAAFAQLGAPPPELVSKLTAFQSTAIPPLETVSGFKPYTSGRAEVQKKYQSTQTLIPEAQKTANIIFSPGNPAHESFGVGLKSIVSGYDATQTYVQGGAKETVYAVYSEGEKLRNEIESYIRASGTGASGPKPPQVTGTGIVSNPGNGTAPKTTAGGSAQPTKAPEQPDTNAGSKTVVGGVAVVAAMMWGVMMI